MQNSWYIKGEGVHHFFCHCGQHDMLDEIEIEDEYDVIEFKREEIDFSTIPNLYYPDNSCTRCGNERYLDRDALLFEKNTRYWSRIAWEYREKATDKSWSVWATLKVPEYDRLLKRFYMKNISLLELRLMHNGVEKSSSDVNNFLKKEMQLGEKYVQLELYLKKRLESQMLSFVQETPSKEIAWLVKEFPELSPVKRQKEMLGFFLNHKQIGFIEIFFWKRRELIVPYASRTLEETLAYVLNHRREKSLRKAHYASYEEQMKDGGYNPLVEYVFSRTIDDPNHLLKLLQLPAKTKQKFFPKDSLEDIYYFIYFLKNFYAEKEVVQLWLNIADGWLNSFYLKDTINLFREERIREELTSMFRKTPLNIKIIHDQLVQHYRIVKKSMLSEATFHYADNLLASEGEFEGLVYSLPKNHRELYDWGESLHNCLSSYTNDVGLGRSVIFAIFIDNQLYYAMEIRNDKIVQLLGIYNRPIEASHKEKVEQWFKEVYLKNRITIFNLQDS